jgi:hypothetical protein
MKPTDPIDAIRAKRRMDINTAATTVTLIEAQQRSHAGWQEKTLASLVNAGLSLLEADQGIDLDAIANDWRFVLAESQQV